MGDFKRLRQARDYLVIRNGPVKLIDTLNYYLARMAASMSRVAASNSEIADYYDIVGWSDEL